MSCNISFLFSPLLLHAIEVFHKAAWTCLVIHTKPVCILLFTLKVSFFNLLLKWIKLNWVEAVCNSAWVCEYSSVVPNPVEFALSLHLLSCLALGDLGVLRVLTSLTSSRLDGWGECWYIVVQPIMINNSLFLSVTDLVLHKQHLQWIWDRSWDNPLRYTKYWCCWDSGCCFFCKYGYKNPLAWLIFKYY